MKKFKMVWSFLKRMGRLDKLYLIAVVGQTLLISLRTLVALYIPKVLIDGVHNQWPVERLLLVLGVIVVALGLLRLLENAVRRGVTLGNERVNLLVQRLFSEKMMSLPYHYLEDPDYLEMKEAAMMGMNIGAVDRLMNNITGILQHGFILIGLSLLLFRLNPLLLVGAFVLQIFISLLVIRQAQLFRTTLESILPINRKLNYYMSTVHEIVTQKDVRLYDMSNMLAGNILVYNRTMMHDFIKMNGLQGIYTSLSHLINYFISGGIILYAGARVLGQVAGSLISMGDFSLYTGSAVNFSTHFKAGLENILDISNQIHFIEPIETFLALPEDRQSGSLPLGEFEKLEFRNVSFAYPKTEAMILKNLSFEINAGEKISVVGLNGAGKSTLIKLICRFFPVTEGEILINGHNIEDYDYSSYMNRISAIFQDFQMLNFTLAENILGEDYQNQSKRQEAEELFRQVGLAEKLKELPHGLDTYLGKSFHEEGVEISGGQLQKVAIVRALYKKADLVILDEPTSALDPLAEAEIYEQFNNLVKDKTAIYISHRMSSSVFCDRILLINQGQMEAFDSHENLMKRRDSLYFKLFTTQAKNYRLESLADTLEFPYDGKCKYPPIEE
ncbi:ABC transporter ATP-binding protein [Microaceticoccus formicicus]|uniref:ABC transporter ATP-binding protein n=1 Tax=Microaceticoccus formicicus TaxID=3118105 RepID=UPI003CD02B4A|nr:ABC transporter ATP-binding protein [Peptoniphilaceae bacterium AMB_02]